MGPILSAVGGRASVIFNTCMDMNCGMSFSCYRPNLHSSFCVLDFSN
jgi:hypothetical protein